MSLDIVRVVSIRFQDHKVWQGCNKVNSLASAHLPICLF